MYINSDYFFCIETKSFQRESRCIEEWIIFPTPNEFTSNLAEDVFLKGVHAVSPEASSRGLQSQLQSIGILANAKISTASTTICISCEQG